MGAMFWLRWSWRDIRKRSTQAVAIAAILALGAGIYAGLGTTSIWRKASLEASLEALSAHDIRVELLGGISLEADAIESAIEAANVASIIDVESRLTARVPVTAVQDGEAIAAAGLVVGVDTESGPRIDRWQIVGDDVAGRAPEAGTVLLDLHFAQAHGLPDSGTLRVGTTELRYSGLALAPEYLNLTTTAGASIQGAATRAVLYAPIEIAREVAGEVPRLPPERAIASRSARPHPCRRPSTGPHTIAWPGSSTPTSWASSCTSCR